MSSSPDLAVRRGELADAEAIGRLLHDFNSEFDDVTPGARKLAERVRQLLAEGEVTVLLAGTGPDGLAVLRFRPGIWTQALECYLAELSVTWQGPGAASGGAELLPVRYRSVAVPPRRRPCYRSVPRGSNGW